MDIQKSIKIIAVFCFVPDVLALVYELGAT